MTATLNRPTAQKKPRVTTTRPVPEILLELAYRLHATRVVRRPLIETVPKKG
jgi:hypothetical protein